MTLGRAARYWAMWAVLCALMFWVHFRLRAMGEFFSPPPGSVTAGSYLKSWLVRLAFLVIAVLILLLEVWSKRKADKSRGIQARKSSVVKRLSIVFVLYAAVLYVYAGLYEALYRDDPRSFLFASEVMQPEMDHFVSEAKDTLQSLQQEEESVAEMLVHFTAGHLSHKTDCDPFPCVDYEIGSSRFLFWVWGPVDGPPTQWRLTSFGRSGERLWEWPVREFRRDDFNVTSQSIQQMASDLDQRLSKSIETYSRYAQNDPSVRTQLWSFWDFLYFSGITLTTVGYGDILPNTTRIRMLVLSEVLVGLFLLGWLMNAILLGSTQREATKPIDTDLPT